MTISRRVQLVVASLCFAGVLAVVAVPASAQAAPIGTDGVINACYMTKGKTKGAVRVVKAGKPCKRKEKAVVWGVAGEAGSAGAGLSSDQVLALLQLMQQQANQIDLLTGRLVDLEGILAGISNGDLTGLLDSLTGRITDLEGILAGISNGDLNALLDSLPVLDLVCGQLSTVTGQTNALRTVLGGLGLNGILTGLGGLLNIPALPTALNPFNCPA